MRADRTGTGRGLLTRAMTAMAAAGMLVASLSAGQAANFFEKNFWLSGPNYSGVVPACDLPGALSRIQSHFATTESRFWSSTLKIDGFERVREIAFRPWGEEFQPRRYCVADAYVSDGKRHKVYYSIIEDGGFIGFSWGVEWCVEGLDRSWTYQPNCRMARP